MPSPWQNEKHEDPHGKALAYARSPLTIAILQSATALVCAGVLTAFGGAPAAAFVVIGAMTAFAAGKALRDTAPFVSKKPKALQALGASLSVAGALGCVGAALSVNHDAESTPAARFEEKKRDLLAAADAAFACQTEMQVTRDARNTPTSVTITCPPTAP
jgi:hypothetical protein